jgi:hypothetical protein
MASGAEIFRENLIREYERRLEGLEISNVETAENKDSSIPFSVSFSIKARNYGIKSGSRHFCQTAFFQLSSNPLFLLSDRVHPIYFQNPWSEIDDVAFKLPSSLEPELIPTPSVVNAGQLANFRSSITFDDKTRVLRFRRILEFGKNEMILFPTSEYGDIKGLFDAIHIADSKVISLKRN